MWRDTFTLMGKFSDFRTRMRNSSLPGLLLNKYVGTLFIFAVWMTFFDKNNFIRQYNRITELADVQRKTHYYEEETAKAKKQLHLLQTDQKALERFAREEYYMKKPNEDIYVIVDKK